MRVLVTGVCGPAGSALARQLVARGETVIGVDMQPVSGAPAEHHLTVPRVDDPEYVERLRQVVVAEGIDLIVPTISEELELFARVRRFAFDALGAVVMVADEGAVIVSGDKYLTMKRLSERGVATPSFVRGDRLGEGGLERPGRDTRLVIKPRVSRGGRGVRVVDAREVGEAPDRSSIVQSFAAGAEYAPMVFRNPRTRLIDACVVVEKTALRDGLVGNAVSVRRCERDEAVAQAVGDLARRAVEALDLTGPVDVDIRIDDDLGPVVLEVNARFGANSSSAPELLDSLLESAAYARAEMTTQALAGTAAPAC